MNFGHEQLHVYQVALKYVRWAYDLAGSLKGTEQDRRRYFEIARGSALECGAIQDILETCGVITAAENQKAKREMLIRIVSMLTKLGKRNYRVEERSVPYHSLDHDNDINLNSDNDHDNDHDNDNECGMSQDLLSVRAER